MIFDVARDDERGEQVVLDRIDDVLDDAQCVCAKWLEKREKETAFSWIPKRERIGSVRSTLREKETDES